MNVQLISSLARIRSDDLLREAAVRRALVLADRGWAARARFDRAFRGIEHLSAKLGGALGRVRAERHRL